MRNSKDSLRMAKFLIAVSVDIVRRHRQGQEGIAIPPILQAGKLPGKGDRTTFDDLMCRFGRLGLILKVYVVNDNGNPRVLK